MSDGAPQKKKNKKNKTGLGFHFLAGLGSGCASAALLQPADLLKTRVQQTKAASLRSALRDVLQGPHPLRHLWRGTTPSVIRTGFGSALYFGMLNHMREYVSRMNGLGSSGTSSVFGAAAVSASASAASAVAGGGGEGGRGGGRGGKDQTSSVLPKLGNVANLATGAAARVAAGFLMNPVTVLKVRYESTHYAYTSLAGAARDIVKTEGMRGFFAGFGATAVRDAPYAGLYVLMYEQSKVQLGGLREVVGDEDAQGKGVQRSGGSSATINFVSGVLAAMAATALTNPFDAIKTRLQIAPGRYRNMIQAARMMLKEEGVRSMFYGLSLRIGRKAVSSALTWTVYEELIRRAERVVEERADLKI